MAKIEVTAKTMAMRTAKNLVAALRAKGVKCECDYEYKPIRDALRDCWYVKKLVECGRTECIHIGLPDAGSFIVVTNDCKLMTGYHVMIQDAVYCIYLEYVDSEYRYEPRDTFDIGNGRFYHDEGGDCGMLLVDPYVFVNWLNSLDFYERNDDELDEAV